MKKPKYTSKPGDKPVGRYSEEMLNQLAKDLHAGQVYTDRHCPYPDLLSMIFMPILFGGLEGIDLNTLGLIWQRMSEAGPRAINGQPIFTSMHLLHRDDYAIVMKKLRRIEKAMKFALNEKTASG